jgi:hypothetical protein
LAERFDERKLDMRWHFGARIGSSGWRDPKAAAIHSQPLMLKIKDLTQRRRGRRGIYPNLSINDLLRAKVHSVAILSALCASA